MIRPFFQSFQPNESFETTRERCKEVWSHEYAQSAKAFYFFLLAVWRLRKQSTCVRWWRKIWLAVQAGRRARTIAGIFCTTLGEIVSQRSVGGLPIGKPGYILLLLMILPSRSLTTRLYVRKTGKTASMAEIDTDSLPGDGSFVIVLDEGRSVRYNLRFVNTACRATLLELYTGEEVKTSLLQSLQYLQEENLAENDLGT